MHKLLFIGLVGSGILAFGLAAPTQAMRPASNADLRACLGNWTSGEACKAGANCNPAAGVIGVGNCTGPQAGDLCAVSVAGAVPTYTCGTPTPNVCCSVSNAACGSYASGICNQSSDGLSWVCVPNNVTPQGASAPVDCAQQATPCP